jgi:hypothetical protein
MQLQLTAAELAVLQDILSTALGELKEEVYKTETAEYKDTLKAREATIQGLLSRLQGASV